MKTLHSVKRYWIILFSCCFVFMANAQTDNCKCCSEVHKAFDFWQGDWQTFTPDGKLAGTNLIEKIQDNCILRENWKSASGGYTGTSYNFFNKTSEQWEQIWIDNQGQHLHLKGGVVDGNMVLQSDAVLQADGTTILNRITWTPLKNGNVRQHWEVKKGEATWVTAFDGLYKPAPQEAE